MMQSCGIYPESTRHREGGTVPKIMQMRHANDEVSEVVAGGGRQVHKHAVTIVQALSSTLSSQSSTERLSGCVQFILGSWWLGMPAHRAATERVAVLAFPAFVLAIPRVRGLSGSTSTIGGSTTATHSPDQTLTSPLPPGCLLSAPHRLTPPGSQLRPRHAHSRSTWVHCQDIHAHLHHLAPCTPRPPLFSAYSVARPCGVCFTKSYSYLSILPVALRHGGLI